MVEADIAYLAGLIDGEGSIFGRQPKRNESPGGLVTLGITMCDRGVLDWCAATFGGKVWDNPRKQHATRDGRLTKRSWTWHIYGGQIRDVLRLLLPYLKVKREQALVGIQIANTYGARRSDNKRLVPQEAIDVRVEGIARLRELNRRGEDASVN